MTDYNFTNRTIHLMDDESVFVSFQGEGDWIGTKAIFVRTAYCNLCCSFCDEMNREREHKEVSCEWLKQKIFELADIHHCSHVIFTGGEPYLEHLVISDLFASLLQYGLSVHYETNGTIAPPYGELLGWVTCSPKRGHMPVLERVSEYKFIICEPRLDIEWIEEVIDKRYSTIWTQTSLWLQPVDDKGDLRKGMKGVLKAFDILSRKYPSLLFRVGIQEHKIYADTLKEIIR